MGKVEPITKGEKPTVMVFEDVYHQACTLRINKDLCWLGVNGYKMCIDRRIGMDIAIRLIDWAETTFL